MRLIQRLHDRIDAWLTPPVVPMQPTWADTVRKMFHGMAKSSLLTFLKFLLWMFG